MSTHEHRTERSRPTIRQDKAAAPDAEPARTRRLGALPIQRRSLSLADAPSSFDPGPAVEVGIRGGAAAMPHGDRIQQAFGRHDVGGIRAHLGDGASQAAQALGAEAFTTGDHVVFDGAPSLHTAAHEAAHVVQQRAGVHLRGRLDTPGDEHERHADAVADRVVRGESVEPLLDRYAGRGGAAVGGAVQRKLVGRLAGLTPQFLQNGLKPYQAVPFRDLKDLLAKLEKADVEIDSFEAAAMFLWPGSPAAEKAKEALDKTQRAAAEKVEKERREKSLFTLFPKGVLGVYYRADNRPEPQVHRTGFSAYKQLSPDSAKAEVRKWFSEDPTAYHQDWISNNNGTKIATGNDIGCMGYGANADGAIRNVYQIHVAGLREVAPTKDVLGVEPAKKQGPSLLLNASTVEAATVIAVGGVRAAETTFFTEIPPGWIEIVYEFKRDDGNPPRHWLTPL